MSSAIQRVVVTGAAGFIGTHLLRYLRGAGTPVLAIVRRMAPDSQRLQGVEYVERDLEHTDTLSDVLRPEDAIVHLAGRAHVMRDDMVAARAAYQRANVEATRMLCRSANECGVHRLVYVSTAKVFGAGRETPFTPADPLAPTDAYSESKVEAEETVRDASRTGTLQWTVVRPPFVYGPGGKGNFPRLVSLARIASLIPLPLASISNRRSILFVGNLVDAIVRCGLHEDAANQVLLPTDAQDVSTPDLLRSMARVRASRALLFPCPVALLRTAAAIVRHSAEMERLTESLRLDSSHLREQWGWEPPFSLERALMQSMDNDLRPAGASLAV